MKSSTVNIVYLPRVGVPANFPLSIYGRFNVQVPASNKFELNPVSCELKEAFNMCAQNHQLHLLDKDNKIITDELFETLSSKLNPLGKSPYIAAVDHYEVLTVFDPSATPPNPEDFEENKPEETKPVKVKKPAPIESLPLADSSAKPNTEVHK